MDYGHDALIFNSANALNFHDIRLNVIRIPEVGLTIREAQNIWDTLNPSVLDLTNFIGSDDQTFLSHIKLKNFASAIVQVGLLRRFLKYNELPKYLIGTVNDDAPLLVALEQISFVELVASSEAFPKERQASANPSGPLLSGVKLDEFAVFKRHENGHVSRLSFETRDVQKMAEQLAQQEGLRSFIFIGPGTWGKPVPGVTMIESIDLDPHLGWFWERGKENKFAVAN